VSNPTNLDRLAALAGIDPSYWDAWGNHHEVSEETKRSLLQSLGIAEHSDAAVEASLAALEEEPWRHPVPPALVLHQGETPRIPVVLPAGLFSKAVNWVIDEERGTRKEGRLLPSDTPPLEVRRVDGRVLRRRSIELSRALAPGYHRLSLPELDGDPTTSLIVAPARCHLARSLSVEGRRWGVSTQVYSIRSRTNWGMGDLTDLGTLIETSARLGAATVGINPLHALFPEDPELAAPYLPSSQLQLNPLYLDVSALPDLAECEAARDLVGSGPFAAAVARARETDSVDYAAVARLKGQVLELLYRSFRRLHLATSSARAAAFAHFQTDGGKPLHRFAVFQALTESFGHRRWPQWPSAYRRPDSEEVARFALRHRERVEFFEYLQWQTDLQLTAASERATKAGMSVGLYRDLAVGVAGDGADAWSEQQLIVRELSIGAPPDPFSPLGQSWGSAPLHPHRLPETGYARFIAALRANMRHAGALRIDHAMGLQRLFLIPAGAPPEAGAYVSYPFEDLLGILTLESRRNRCVVIGEDLGTVPEGFRDRMGAAGALSYRVFYFEKEGDRFKRPDEYPHLALACPTTHDLPTLKGYIEGRDIALRLQLRRFASEQAQRTAGEERDCDRRLLTEALEAEGLLPSGASLGDPTHLPALIDAVHRYLARSSACLFVAQLDDLFNETDQINLPGTVFEHPNWRRKLCRQLYDLTAEPALRALLPELERARRVDRPAPRTGLSPDRS
jgi:(1->4)-alpha-D-glucan 1-alpha-D-glucosylmutase